MVDKLTGEARKAALSALTREMAVEFAQLGVRVNAVAPGLTIATPDYDAAQMERLGEMMPLGRLPQAEEIAQAVLYLTEASAITGQTLYVDGGAHLKSYERDFMHLCR